MAMSVGLPVVALDRGNIATLMKLNDLARDLDDYFERLADLVDARAARQTVGERMSAQIKRRFGFEPGTRNLVAALEQVAAEGRAWTR